jgi:hypothetical protein
LEIRGLEQQLDRGPKGLGERRTSDESRRGGDGLLT